MSCFVLNMKVVTVANGGETFVVDFKICEGARAGDHHATCYTMCTNFATEWMMGNLPEQAFCRRNVQSSL